MLLTEILSFKRSKFLSPLLPYHSIKNIFKNLNKSTSVDSV